MEMNDEAQHFSFFLLFCQPEISLVVVIVCWCFCHENPVNLKSIFWYYVPWTKTLFLLLEISSSSQHWRAACCRLRDILTNFSIFFWRNWAKLWKEQIFRCLIFTELLWFSHFSSTSSTTMHKLILLRITIKGCISHPTHTRPPCVDLILEFHCSSFLYFHPPLNLWFSSWKKSILHENRLKTSPWMFFNKKKSPQEKKRKIERKFQKMSWHKILHQPSTWPFKRKKVEVYVFFVCCYFL